MKQNQRRQIPSKKVQPMNPIIIILLPIIAGIIVLGCATTPRDDMAQTIGHPEFEQLCSKCHTLDRVFQAHQELNKDQMRQIVMTMSAKKDSGIHANVVDRIVNEMY